MFCPQCGTEMPDDARFCPSCGRDMAPAGEAAPTEPLPVQHAAPAPAAPQYAPPPTAPMPVVPPVAAQAGYAPPPMTPIVAPPKRRPGLIAAIVIIVLLLLCCGGSAAAAFLVPAIRDRMPCASPATPPSKPATSTITPDEPDTGATDADVQAAEKVVNAFYAGINAGDLESVKAIVAEDTKSAIDPGAFEGWSATTFEFTRGWVESDIAYVIGRENPQPQFGSGDNGGGVKFTLIRDASGWLISNWQGVDSAQVEGSDTTGSSTGLPGPLTEAVAKELMTQLLDARKIGAANNIRRLASERFLRENGDAWLDGFDNSAYFSYVIKSVKVAGQTATVVVSETWPDGEQTATYGLIEQGGAVLADSWQPQ